MEGVSLATTDPLLYRDDMDLEDGGVSVDIHQAMSSDQLGSTDFLAIKSLYHQAPKTVLENSGCAWILPVNPAPYLKNRRHEQSYDHPIIKEYTKHFGLIKKHWECEPEECIPAELRKHTPYSLSLLCWLRSFASVTKKNGQIAHSLLLESQQQRLSVYGGLPTQALSLVETNPAEKRSIEMGEDRIWENLHGLMICDVEQAISRSFALRKEGPSTKKGMKAPNKAKPEPLAEVPRLETPRRSRYIARLEAKMARDFEQTKQPSTPVSEKVKEHRKARWTAQERKVSAARSKDQPVSAQADPMDAGVVAPNTVPANKPKWDKRQENQMSRILNSIHFNSRDDMEKRDANRLQEGGFSRITHGKKEMPSEKFKIGSTTLPEMIASKTDEAALARLGQLQLSDTAKFGSSFQLRPEKSLSESP